MGARSDWAKLIFILAVVIAAAIGSLTIKAVREGAIAPALPTWGRA